MPSQLDEDQAVAAVRVAEQPDTLLRSAYLHLMTKVEAGFARLGNRRYWLAIGTVAAVTLSMLITFPRVSTLTGKDPFIKYSTWPSIEEQSRHPFSTDLKIYQVPEQHVGKRAFRLTLPLAERFLHLDRNGIIVLQMGLGVLLLYLAGRIVDELYRDRVVALAAVFALSSIFAGKAAFLELDGHGDGFAFAFFTFAAFFRASPLIFLSILIACFTDERAAVAAPLLAIYWAIRDAKSDGTPDWISLRLLAVMAGVGGYLGARLYLEYRYGLHTPIGDQFGVGFDLIRKQVNQIKLELLYALSGLWLWVLCAFYLIWRRRHRSIVLITAVLAIGVICTALAVFDIQRSLGYLLPLIFIAFAAAAHYGSTIRDSREIAIIAFLSSFVVSVGISFHQKYAPGRLFPIEISRLIYYYSN